MSAEYDPPLNINWDRPNTEREETYNNVLAIRETELELPKVTLYRERNGKPQEHWIDNLDGDTIMQVPMDEEWEHMVRWGINNERMRLAKKGVVFERKRQP